ncbi:MAG: AAA family ATPase [Alphaproteobacteria bacterium]|nr:AAA family ATPase [Alphaproteobacteria bacterium]
MRIRRLELHGFKSFADRTVLTFGSGISGIVGPNGCGKSNVVDALKWVIGEQSAKSLRGGEMADVIFAGAAERKPVGYAEVGLVLSSEGGEPFPGELARFTELHVARRLYRSGASEYLLNQTRVRRKDVVDLFMDTGVGNNLYSFIEQGRIDKIVTASPEDRRALVDEAAGITRYKKRRAEALSKLEATGGQLDRAADVAEEMERRLKTLERQGVKAAQYRRLRALVRQREIALGVVKFADVDADVSDLRGTLGGGRGALAELEAALEESRATLELRRGEARVAQDAAERARDGLAEVDARLRETQAASSLQDLREGELAQQLEDAIAEAARDEARATEAAALAERAAGELLQVDPELAQAQERAAGAEEVVTSAQAALDGARGLLRVAEGDQASRGQAHAVLAARVEALRQRAQELPARLAAATERLDKVVHEQVVVGKRVTVAAQVLAERRGGSQALRAARDEARAEVERREKADLHARDAVRHAELELDALAVALDEAVAAAETTAGQADEEVAARVGRVAQQLENALRDQERQEAGRRADEERARRGEVEQLEARQRTSLAEARAEADGRLARVRAEAEAAHEAEDARRQAAIDAALGEVSTGVATAEAAAREAQREAVEGARSRRSEAEARLAEAREALGDVEARQAVALRRQRELEGRFAALDAEQRAAAALEAGDEAVARALPDAPRLLDVLDVPADDRAWVHAALGDRLVLPVLAPEQVAVALDAAAGVGPARVIVAGPEGPRVARLLGHVEVVEDLDAALGVHLHGAGGAVVRSSGLRIEPDGVVVLPDPAGRGVEAARRGEQLAELATEREAAAAQLAALEVERTAARARVEGASIAVRKTTEAVDLAEHDALDRVSAVIAQVREQAEARVRALQQERASWRQADRERLDAQVAEEVARRDAAIAQVAEAGQQALEAARAEVEAWLATRHAELEELRAARRAELAVRLEQVRVETWEQVRAQTADVAVRRERLREEVGQGRAALDKARAQAERAGQAFAAAQAAVRDAERAVAEHELVLARLDADHQAAERQVEVLAERRDALEEERAGLEASAQDVGVRLAEAEAELRAVAAQAQAGEGALGEARAGVEQAATRLADAQRALEAARDARSTLRERRAGLLASCEAAAREAEGAEVRREAARQRIGELERLRAQAAEARDTARAGLDALAPERQEASQALDEARTRAARLAEERDALATLVEGKEAEAQVLRTDLLREEQREHQLVTERDALVQRIRERYQVELDEVLGQLRQRDAVVLEAPPEVRDGLELGGRQVEGVEAFVLHADLLDDADGVAGLVAELEVAREALGRIGEVNLTALEEYAELHGRFSELDGQRADLQESVESIREAIAKMNRTCRERFREAFDRVDEAFRKAYPELVGGGEARLELTDEEDLLETGVDILVRPPGKRMQHLGLLSGGEKAMTAIALLLSLFSVKPSPFCILDEVDAPLDEANGARFNDMIRQMSAKTQFLVVTHNRKTMECADTLYGITMPTPGCSASTSVRVD